MGPCADDGVVQGVGGVFVVVVPKCVALNYVLLCYNKAPGRKESNTVEVPLRNIVPFKHE